MCVCACVHVCVCVCVHKAFSDIETRHRVIKRFGIVIRHPDDLHRNALKPKVFTAIHKDWKYVPQQLALDFLCYVDMSSSELPLPAGPSRRSV